LARDRYVLVEAGPICDADVGMRVTPGENEWLIHANRIGVSHLLTVPKALLDHPDNGCHIRKCAIMRIISGFLEIRQVKDPI
jgi:hypothetical protein